LAHPVYTCTSDGKRPTSNIRKSDSRKKQTIGGRGPKSLLRWDVSSEIEKYLATVYSTIAGNVLCG